MKKTLVIIDVTQMPKPDEVCVVGLDDHGTTVRPVAKEGFLKSYLYDGKGRPIVRHGAKVELDLHPMITMLPHIEDMAFDPASIVNKGLCNQQEWESVLLIESRTEVEGIYDGLLQGEGWVSPGAKTRSIGTLSHARILGLELTTGSVKPRIRFSDRAGRLYERPASDLTLWDFCFSSVRRHQRDPRDVEKGLLSAWQKADRIYLRLGLARAWQQDGKCWLQVTGVYSFPDYMQGKCFADFRS